MGGGKWSDATYSSTRSTRASKGIDDFHYSKTSTTVHPNLDPKRINTKPFKKLESRDSVEHPNSNAVFVSFDVTGSNHSRAVEAQKRLPNLMGLLSKYISDPQVLFAANDDYTVCGKNSVQISDFESDIRIDEHLRNILLVGLGGGNDGESYDLILYAAAFKTVLDCMEKRNRKGYFFMYADEPIFTHVQATEVQDIFGDDTEGKLSVSAVIEKLKELYHVFVIWPQGGYDHARAQYETLFGKECVVTLQHPNLICELIGSLVGLTEEKIATAGEVTSELVKAGISAEDAQIVATAVKPVAHRLLAAGR